MEHFQVADELGLPGLVISEHGTTSSWYAAKSAARDTGLNFVPAMEGYWEVDHRNRDQDKGFGRSPAHFLLIAKNAQGATNISKIATLANTEGYYQKPRFDNDILRDHLDGVMATTTCLGGAVGKYIEQKEFDLARDFLVRQHDLFGDDYYLELQPHPDENQRNLNRFLVQWGGREAKYVLAADSHYPRPADKELQKIGYLISIGKTYKAREYVLNKEGKDLYPYPYEYHLQTPQMMLERMVENNPGLPLWAIENGAENSLSIVRDTRVELPEGHMLMPDYPEDDVNGVLKQRLAAGFKRFVKDVPRKRERIEEYRERLRYEYRLIAEKFFTTYFLTVADVVDAAHDLDVMVGVGRGSAGGSLVSYLLGITGIDPVDEDLSLERFMSPSRGGYKMTQDKPSRKAELIEMYDKLVRQESA